MIGRGIDQVLRYSVDPRLFEPWLKSAEAYVDLAVRANGPIPAPVSPEYVWGDALEEMDRLAPDARIVNLETSVTTSDAAWPNKDVLYRTHPGNVEVLTAGGIDCCTLANNHVLDWGAAGLVETVSSVRQAGIATAGAGPDRLAAAKPALIDVSEGRIIVVAFASTTSGVPASWAAADDQPGVELIEGWSLHIADTLAARLAGIRRPGDVVVASVHWGSNWGHDIPDAQLRLAHRLVDVAGADVVHGHSSHHPRAIELYRGRLILHGCGDFLTDYEGIAGHEEFRDDLVLAYCPTLDAATGEVLRTRIVPFQLRRFQLIHPSRADASWLADALDRHSRSLGTRIDVAPNGDFEVKPLPGYARS